MVKDIFVLECQDKKQIHRLPFFADGFPGLLYIESQQPAVLYPKNKQLSHFFIYGQTLAPIEILVKGSYRILAFQLYPYAVKSLFHIHPKEINDDCYDLCLVASVQTEKTLEQLLKAKTTKKCLKLIANYLETLAKQTPTHHEVNVQLAIDLILSSQGQISIKKLKEQLSLTERTIQRQFIEYIGISPKQFAKIIQFQNSLQQISSESFSKMADVVYENGYADQSHFIRSFKKFTGKKPSLFK